MVFQVLLSPTGNKTRIMILCGNPGQAKKVRFPSMKIKKPGKDPGR
jgi:hypothetical protein